VLLSPLHWGGLREEAVPLPRKFLDFWVENGAFWCIMGAIYADCSNLKLYGSDGGAPQMSGGPEKLSPSHPPLNGPGTLWNQLPASLWQPRAGLSILEFDLPTHASSAFSINSPLSSSKTPSFLHSHLNTYLFHKDMCYDHKFVIVSPIAYDHGCVPIGRREQWHHSTTFGYDQRSEYMIKVYAFDRGSHKG